MGDGPNATPAQPRAYGSAPWERAIEPVGSHPDIDVAPEPSNTPWTPPPALNHSLPDPTDDEWTRRLETEQSLREPRRAVPEVPASRPPDRPPTQRHPRPRSRRRPPHTRPDRTRCRSPICWPVRAPTAAVVHVGTRAPRSRTTTQRSLLQRRPPTTATQTFSHRCTKPHRSVLSTPMGRPTSTRRTWTTPMTRPSTTRPPRVGFGHRIWTTTSTPAPFPSGWATRTPRSEKKNRNAHGGPST